VFFLYLGIDVTVFDLVHGELTREFVAVTLMNISIYQLKSGKLRWNLAQN